MELLLPLIENLSQIKQYLSTLSSLNNRLIDHNHLCFVDWSENLKGLITTTRQMQENIIDIISKINSTSTQDYVDQIQVACEMIGSIWIDIRSQLLSIAMANVDDLRHQVDNHLKHLVTKAVIVVDQPPQVIKTNCRFGTTIRFLCPGLLSDQQPVVLAETSIINSVQAQYLSPLASITCGVLSNNKVTFQQESNRFVASFDNIICRKVKRTEKKGKITVTDEKFALSYHFRVTITHHLISYDIQALSLPIVVIVHGNQETNAWATIIWDNAFALPSRQPFQVPDEVEWSLLSRMLSNQFQQAIGAHLTDYDLHFLATKVLGNDNLTKNQMRITWFQFAKDPLPGRCFTFWEWFHSILKLSREHLVDVWSPKRLVHGFISRQACESILSNERPGTFLLRFCESDLGSITIVTHHPKLLSVINLTPFSANDLQIRSLVDRIHDLDCLIYLYPGVIKNDVFFKNRKDDQPLMYTFTYLKTKIRI